MKKHSFGEGKWNGVGGKLEKDESVEDAVIRETKEEIGVILKEENLIKVADLHFRYSDKPDWDQHCHVYFVEEWEGDPVESGEMYPKWHHKDSLPFEKMWVDDPHWLPKVIEGKRLNATIHFINEGSEIERVDVKEI